MTLATALAALGVAPAAMPDSYSWTEHGVSESAAQGVDGAWVARTGFLLFGVGVLWLLHLSHRRWGRVATVMHATFGVSMLGVAAFSARSWDPTAPYIGSEDALHSAFATVMGFGFVAAVVATTIARRPVSWRAVAPDVGVVAVATGVPLTMDGPVWGLLQRLMFLAAAAWYVRESTWPAREPSADGRRALR